MYAVGQKNLKNSRPKKFVKSNKSISQMGFLPKSIFCYFKNVQKSTFELGKSLKLNIFHENQVKKIREIAFLAGLNFFSVQKIYFWPFWK